MCLLHSYADPAHELETARILRRQLPGVFVVASCEIAGEYREYERASTTSIDAYLGPVVRGYLRSLRAAARRRGLPPPALMQSSGGLAAVEEAAAHPARLLLSGPAGGVAAVAGMGGSDAIAFDMGGTSCDVSLIRGGSAGRSTERAVGGLPVRLPMVDIHTVGAGGGSVAWLDDGGALRVGPRSAGAEPGPACYGRGGEEPTVTDANLVLGRLDADVAAGRQRAPGCGRRAGRPAAPGGRIPQPARGRGGRRGGGQPGDGAGDPGRLGRARPRPARAGAGRVRRRRAAARLRGGRGAGHAPGAGAGGGRRAVGARHRRR